MNKFPNTAGRFFTKDFNDSFMQMLSSIIREIILVIINTLNFRFLFLVQVYGVSL